MDMIERLNDVKTADMQKDEKTKALGELYKELESGLTYVGSSAIEDKL